MPYVHVVVGQFDPAQMLSNKEVAKLARQMKFHACTLTMGYLMRMCQSSGSRAREGSKYLLESKIEMLKDSSLSLAKLLFPSLLRNIVQTSKVNPINF
jgi:hypothetical protein